VDKEFELPTLIHFAAKFGFKELCAKLIDLPDASYVGKFSNCNGQQPNDIAEIYRHTELRRFLDSFLEMVSCRPTFKFSFKLKLRDLLRFWDLPWHILITYTIVQRWLVVRAKVVSRPEC